ncbi:MAG: BadF/BadG/BcrA/BcrD ATPase family protein, partial [Acidimicrobiia bacterium]
VFHPPALPAGTCVGGYIGLDGGSTSSKAVLIDEQGELLAKTYRLSQGNPIEDARTLLAQVRDQVSTRGCQLEVLGFGATGYAADVLDQALCVDANLVETVAHMMSAQRYCGDDVDVICDIGGQDIKVLFLQNGVIKSFRLSNQCSAGNGMLLQAMADQFGVALHDFADIAFQARLAPRFSYGCAVFLDADRVNYQKEGFSREELFAGLAQVLPKNIWQYVVQIPRLAELGRKFVLQGGTQYNLAAVKAQVDYIRARVPGAEVRVHPHCGEAGAIGAALEARRQVAQRGQSRFIGLESAIHLEYTTRTDASTRCTFCDNHCTRTFIDTRTPQGTTSRYIAGFSCEKGTVESKQAVVALNQTRKRLKARYPNLVDYEAEAVFRH